MFISSCYLILMRIFLLNISQIDSNSISIDDDDSFDLDADYHSSNSPYVMIIGASLDDYFAILNCSTPSYVPHQKLDWYFQVSSSSNPPRVIWQRGRSNSQRYLGYSSDQLRHFLQIKPINLNDSGIYMCLDQTSGYSAKVELIVHDDRNCAPNSKHFRTITIILLLVVSRYTTRNNSQ